MSVNFNYPNNPYLNNSKPKTGTDNFGAISPQTQATIKKVETSVKDTAQKSWVGRQLESFGIKDPKKAIISIIGAVAVVFGLSGLINKGIKSGKFFAIGKKIDGLAQNNKILKNISDKLKNSSSNGAIKSLKTWFNDRSIVKFLKDKSNLLRPKFAMAKPILVGTKGEAIDTVTDVMRKLYQEEDAFKVIEGSIKKLKNLDADDVSKLIDKLNFLGKSGKNSDTVSTILKGIKDSLKPGEAISDISGVKDSIIALMRANPSRKQLTPMLQTMTQSKNVKKLVKYVGEINADDTKKFELFPKIYEKIRATFVKEGTSKVDIDKMLKVLSNDGEIGKMLHRTPGGFFTRQTVNMAEALKKYAVLVGDGANTGMGNKIQQLLLRGVEAMTNGVTAKNLMGLIMGVNIYNGVMNKTQEAPKGEKISTFAEEAVSDMGHYMLLPISGSLLYGAASLKNWGVKDASKKALEKAGEVLLSAKATRHVDDAAKGVYKAAKKAYKSTLKQVSKDGNILQRLTRKIGNLFAVGLQTSPLKGNISNKIRGFGGGAMRFLVIMMAITPFLLKPIMNVCHKIFGKPTNSNYNDKPKDTPVETAPHNSPTPNSQTTAPAQPQNANTPQQGSTNYLDMYKDYKPSAQTPVSDELPARKISNENKRTYIPSPVSTLTESSPSNYSPEEMAAALRLADLAEKNAMKFIKP